MRALLFALAFLASVAAVTPSANAQTLQSVLQDNAEAVAKPARRTVEAVLAALSAAQLEGVPEFLESWRDRNLWQRNADGLFFVAAEADGGLVLTDLDTGAESRAENTRDFSQIRPNAGVRRVIDAALVQFLLSDPDLNRRLAALDAISRDPAEDQLEPLRASIDGEGNSTVLARKQQLERQLTALYDADPAARITAIEALSGDLSVEVRGILSRILSARDAVAAAIPEGVNVAATLTPGEDFDMATAYARLVDADLAPATVQPADVNAALIARIAEGSVAGVPVATLNTEAARVAAYRTLVAAGEVPPFITPDEREAAIAAHVFYQAYNEPNAEVTAAAEDAQAAIATRLAAGQAADLTLDALSLASIYFLAAVGLAITFGVMGVINMAHGEFIMMGAYTGYVVQLFVPDYTLSILIALPLAFAVTFGAGVAMERLVIRWLYHRPLETLLATFGISIALQQLAKNIFGTQARPLTSPDWLAGAWVINDVVQISYIRIAIFFLALIFLGLILFILKRTRLGLEVRAVTQNPGMAASMGINPDRINMLTFGLGSGIAGIAGVAIGLYAKVTSEMGSDYIVQSFMTVVVGGVGNVWGTLAGATMIGFTQKGIEWFNPSNTLAAQTFMILFVILFIQFRPKGIVALRGRAAGD
ncbi:urea ABC transporter permease subunit UrtB [Jannaschia pohangensis]|uniref:Amino acid/amide ABC transporter membrane protein 1, HAAT family n=1 Tax=Jannaschia pohangensis TaxID=390807 RepID=A0A1I3R4N5_9RHOB|nr:urea ABC transporter permease subunit UrtB [Jannaschia pohangensis]SFJ40317.1 amino acid/amide ABC transporter membrane protein 1, HAAT family [Jannaschia pohangensis]